MRAHVVENGMVANTIEVESLDFMPNLIDASNGGQIGDSWNGEIFSKRELSVDLVKAKTDKNTQINTWRETANKTSFTFLGKQIAVDDLSTKDILFANAEILNRGVLPANWVGGWKTMDNSFVPIATVAAWRDFISAMYGQGVVNFAHSQALKAQLEAATTLADVEAIKW